ncbi:EAL domain-containing protein [Kushneria aurantia]|uniref:EAL domain-containing protein n=1 Tax=Kushneria aurantia TaxID=504092 RepID=A0ABV6G1Y0_9GAMM|nr:EAL domain-containing protein [Kushneria aurantia]
MTEPAYVASIMKTALLRCPAGTRLSDAAVRMSERYCSSMLITRGDEVLGIWTEQDALMVDFADPGAAQCPVEQVMSSPITSIKPHATIDTAARIFDEKGIRHLLVVDDDETPLGIVSRNDIALEKGLESYLRLRKVENAMRSAPLTLAASLPLSEAVQRMRTSPACDAVIVRYDDHLGILTTRDLVRFVASYPGNMAIGRLASRPLLSINRDEALINARDRLIHHRLRHLAVLDDSEEVIGILGFADIISTEEYRHLDTLRDTLEQHDSAIRQSRQSLRLAEQVIESTLEGIMITDAGGRIEFVNPAFTHLTGYELDEAVGHTPGSLLSSGRQNADFYQNMWHAMHQHGYWRGEIWNRRKGGELYLEMLTVTAIYDEAGETSHFAAMFSDITQVRENEQRVHHLAWYDALTGLPNRRLIEDRLSLATRHARRHSQQLAVVFIDLDHFKQINDSLDHAAGDELLTLVARRLENCLRDDDSLGRLGGDEFIALLPNVGGVDEAVSVVRRMIDAISAPFDLRRRQVRVGCSLGVSFYPSDANSAETLIQHADAAMYRAKREGRNTWRLYSSDMEFHNNRRMTLETALRESLAQGEGIEAYYQPLFERDSGRLYSAEALMRWHHPQLGQVSPGEFIPLAESAGLILQLGQRLLDQVLQQLHDWLAAGLEPVPIAINLSPRQFWQHDLIDDIRTRLEAFAIPAELISFELTESTLLDRHQQAITALEALRDLGHRVAIDDFGTGYSSLSYLQDLPITTLKIDRTFIQALTEGNRRGSEAILAAVTGLAEGLDLQVVAEGVETHEQLDALARFPVQLIQGFLFGRPANAATFTTNWLIRRA